MGPGPEVRERSANATFGVHFHNTLGQVLALLLR
jgi:hypothetical protein